MANRKRKSYPDNKFYEVRWYGRERTLMSRNYCRDRESVQKYIDGKIHACISGNCQVFGTSPDYFIVVGSDRSGIDIRKTNEVKRPYNMLVDKFDQLHLLYSCPFISMLQKEDLEEFARQEMERNRNAN